MIIIITLRYVYLFATISPPPISLSISFGAEISIYEMAQFPLPIHYHYCLRPYVAYWSQLSQSGTLRTRARDHLCVCAINQ